MYEELAKPFKDSNPPKGDAFIDIGGVLLSFMAEKKIDGAELARLSGVSESEVYNVLKNRRSRSGLKTLQKLAAPFGKSLTDIFNRLEEHSDGNLKKLDKDPVFIMEFKKQGVTIVSDIPACPEFFIGKITLTGGGKGFSSEGLRENCLIYLRMAKGSVEVDYLGKTHSVGTYQKILFNGRHAHAIRNKSGGEIAEALLITAPSFGVAGPA